MTQKVNAASAQFMLGLFEGLFAGIGVMIVFHRMLAPVKASVNQSIKVAERAASTFRQYGAEIPLKRESGETAADPSQLVTANAGQARTYFERSGGSPGPDLQGEILERPGHPGQPMPERDASKPVHPSSRTVKIS